MEQLILAFLPVISLIAQYPAFFILVFVCLIFKGYRGLGIMLLILFVIFGYHPWIVVVAFIFTVLLMIMAYDNKD